MGPNAVTQQIGFGKKQVIKSPSGCHLSPFPPLPHPCDARVTSGGPSKRVPSHNTILLERAWVLWGQGEDFQKDEVEGSQGAQVRQQHTPQDSSGTGSTDRSLLSLPFLFLMYFYPYFLLFKFLHWQLDERVSSTGKVLRHVTPTLQGREAQPQTLPPRDGLPTLSLARHATWDGYFTSLYLRWPLCERQVVVVTPSSQLAVRTR